MMRRCTGPALATMMLSASVTPAFTALTPPAPEYSAPREDSAPIVCLVDSAYGIDANTPRICFKLMHDSEVKARRERMPGRLQLGFSEEVAPPVLRYPDIVIDVRDDRLAPDQAWRLNICWARIDRARTQKAQAQRARPEAPTERQASLEPVLPAATPLSAQPVVPIAGPIAGRRADALMHSPQPPCWD